MAQKPLDPNEDSVFVNVRLVESMAETLRDIANAVGATRSEVIREALGHYVEQHREVFAS